MPWHIGLPRSHILPPGPLWLFLWIWLERKPVPGRYGLTCLPQSLTQTARQRLDLDPPLWPWCPQQNLHSPLLTQPGITQAPALPSLPLTCVPLTTTPLSAACAPGHFGADCHLQCQCRNGGTCDRFSGCVCPSGWHGMHCEKSGTRVFEIT